MGAHAGTANIYHSARARGLHLISPQPNHLSHGSHILHVLTVISLFFIRLEKPGQGIGCLRTQRGGGSGSGAGGADFKVRRL